MNRRSNVEESAYFGFRGESGLLTNFLQSRINFTSNHKDLVDCYNAIRNYNSGLSDWSRFFVFCLGLMCLFGFFFGYHQAEYRWQPWVWLVLGITIVWKTAIKPFLEIRGIKKSNSEDEHISLEFTEREISISQSDGGRGIRKWDEVECAKGFGTGVCVWLTDKTMNWIPNRAFESKDRKDQFVSDVLRMIEKVESVSS